MISVDPEDMHEEKIRIMCDIKGMHELYGLLRDSRHKDPADWAQRRNIRVAVQLLTEALKDTEAQDLERERQFQKTSNLRSCEGEL